MFAEISIMTAADRKIEIEVNGAWIRAVDKDMTLVFERKPMDKNWYDEKHSRVMLLVNQLELALKAME